MAMASIAGAVLAQDQRRTVPRVAPEIVRETVASLADSTDRVLFADLWLLPQITPCDRSLVTVAALIAGNKSEQLPFRSTCAMDAGLTRDEMSEIVTHLAFYSGWPNAMSAVPVVRSIFDDRPA